VLTVSVEVCGAAPLIVTEVGFRLHVGMSLTPDSFVVTLQVRFTFPLNPFVPATLIVPVLPLVVPGVTVKDVVPPDPGAKLGSAVMLRLTVVVALNELLVPVMVTITGLEVVAAELVAASVSIWVPAADPGVKVAETPVGRPVAASVIVPVNPPKFVAEIVLVPLPA
jgi:hypothetical protein